MPIGSTLKPSSSGPYDPKRQKGSWGSSADAKQGQPPLERRPFSRPFFIGRESKGRTLCLDTVPDLVALGLIHEDPPADLVEGSTAATADVVTLGG